MRTLLLTAALALGASACAPTLPALLAAHRYDEALCQSTEGATASERNDSVVLSAVEAELHPAVQVHAFSRQELESAFAKADAEVRAHASEKLARVFVVQTHFVTRKGPVEQAWMSGSLLRGGGDFDPINSEEKLAKLFGETLPQAHEEGPGVIGTLSAWGDDLSKHKIANALTLGIWSALTGPSATSTMVSPTREDYLRTAPLTTLLQAMIPSNSCREVPGGPCEKTSLYPRPTSDEGRMPVSFRFTFNVKAWQEGGLFTRGRACESSRVVEVKLPPGGTMEERIAAKFGEQARELSELAR